MKYDHTVGRFVHDVPPVPREDNAVFVPKKTDAQWYNSATGQVLTVSAPGALILFSTDVEDKGVIKALSLVADEVEVSDGQGVVCPPMQYGQDGRHVTLVKGIKRTDNVNEKLPFQLTVGELLAQQFYGPAWNGMRQGPYVNLYVDLVYSPEPGKANVPIAAEVHWGK